MPTETELLRSDLQDVVDSCDESAWSMSESMGRDGKWLNRKLRGERRVYLSDVYAVRWYVREET